MNINRHNYEQYLIDYLDKKLNAVEGSKLLLFVEQNPDIKEEFEGMENMLLAKTEYTFEESHLLKKPSYYDVKSQYENLLIAKLEKDISTNDYKKLEEGFILYPELKKDEALFTKTVLLSDKNIYYENKKSLYKTRKLIVIENNIWIRIAAILLIFALISLITSRLNNKIETSKKYTHQTTIPEIKKHEAITIDRSINPVSVTERHIKTKDKENVTSEINIKPRIQVNHLHTETIEAKSLAGIEKPSPSISFQQIEISASMLSYKAMPIEVGNNIAQPKYITLLDVFNKLTGADIAINKNADGQLKHFAIAGLGIEWEKSK